MHYFVALSDTQMNISSTLLHVLTSRIENFKSILNLNLLTQLKYSNWIFWLDLNTQVKNSDLNQVLTSWVLDLNLSTRLDAISLFLLRWICTFEYLLVNQLLVDDLISFWHVVDVFIEFCCRSECRLDRLDRSHLESLKEHHSYTAETRQNHW